MLLPRSAYGDGVSYRVAYTISDAHDQAPEHLAASSGRPQDTNDIEAWEGPSDFDVRHRLVANFVAELPFGAGKPFASDGVAGAVLGGWTVSGIYTARSGRPFTVTQGSLEGATWLPNLTGDPQGSETVDSVVQPGRVSARAGWHVWKRRSKHSARPRLHDVRHERAAADSDDRPSSVTLRGDFNLFIAPGESGSIRVRGETG